MAYCSRLHFVRCKEPTNGLDAYCGFYRPDAICQLTSGIKPVDSCSKSVNIKLHQVCEHQTCCNLIFTDLLQVDETTAVRNSASLLTTCNRLVVIKLEQGLVIAVAFLAVYCTTKVEASVLRAFRNWKADKFTSFFNLFILLQEYVFVTADENENSLK